MYVYASSIIATLLFALHPSLITAAPGAAPGEVVARAGTCALGGKHIGNSCSGANKKGQLYACGDHRVVRLPPACLSLSLSPIIYAWTHVMLAAD